MKKRNSDFLLNIQGSGFQKLEDEYLVDTNGLGYGQAIVGGLACGFGLAALSNPITLSFGLALTIAGCGAVFGDW
jgi:hypothetical protein